jgi:hypothetical protein
MTIALAILGGIAIGVLGVVLICEIDCRWGPFR